MIFVKDLRADGPEHGTCRGDARADAVGFVFAPSPRRITLERAASIGRELPPAILKVGVFVSPSLEAVERSMTEAGLDLAQIHGAFPAGGWKRLRWRAIRALKVGWDRPDMALLAHGRPRFLLLDASRPGLDGGTGVIFPWVEAAAYRDLGVPLLIAGGLNPANVRDALRATDPAGVDVSSGVESAPGRKDPALIAAFVAAVREWELEKGFET